MRIAALDIGGTNIKYGLFDRAAPFAAVQVQTAPTRAHIGGRALIEEHVAGLISECGEVDAIAVSTSGQVNSQRGEIIFATDSMPGYTGVGVKAILEGIFRKPAFVLNDVNAAALGEAAYGAGREYPDFLCITYGTGIGGAIIMGGRVYEGCSGSAGEFGHMTLHSGGAACPCGRRGCYEAYASTAALVRRVGAALGRDVNGREVLSQLGDIKVKAIYESWLDDVCAGLVSITHIFNPGLIVLGGGFMENDMVIDALAHRLRERIIPSYGCVTLKRAELGNRAGMLGAAYHALMQLEG